ncbi:VOC family protein [Bosea vestrisii]|uniref:VOC family protein n=1 Tax=Bosea vestrisii TaxID=151416 RepID=UPI0024DF7F6F|nr:VOC family protein [Bosea vestrisii]WID98823.1 VOC family protein [Bosea vestrisii]
MTSGLHHVTLITRKVQANVDFYVGFLGLRLVKRTGGYEDARQLHLFYGDAHGSPGSLVTFLVWEDGSPGRAGHGQVSEIAFAVAPTAIGFWLERSLRFGIAIEGPLQQFGETVLRLRDPDGFVVKLVGSALSGEGWESAGVPPEHRIHRLRSVTLLTATTEETAHFLTTHAGFARQASEGGIQRLRSDTGDCLDIRDAGGFWPGIPGTGTADHVAVRVPDAARLSGIERDLSKLNSSATTLHDRQYFISLYVREPGGTLIEFATDGPGFTVDEPVETLGTQLFVPPEAQNEADDILAVLPQFALPGEERVIYRDLPFVHRFHQPADSDGSVIVLLHGSGGNETDLMPLAQRIAPRATLLGLRGRSTEEGTARWFRRHAERAFDQDDIRFEAGALAAFVEGARAAYNLAPERLIFLGYSNGANLLAAAMQLHPELVQRAVLLRPAAVLEEPPATALTGTAVLLLTGAEDPYGDLAARLESALRQAGADVEAQVIPAGHALTEQDRDLAADWLSRHSP